jgi:hypothetical protein
VAVLASSLEWSQESRFDQSQLRVQSALTERGVLWSQI